MVLAEMLNGRSLSNPRSMSTGMLLACGEPTVVLTKMARFSEVKNR